MHEPLPFVLQPFGAHQRLQHFGEVTGGNVFEIEPRDQFVDGLAQSARQDRGGEPLLFAALADDHALAAYSHALGPRPSRW